MQSYIKLLSTLYKQRRCGVSAVCLHASTVHVGYGCKELGFGPSLPALFCNSCRLSFKLLPSRGSGRNRQLNCSIVYCHWHVWVDVQRSALAIERTCGVHTYHALSPHCDGVNCRHEVEALMWSYFHVAQSAALLPLAYAKCSINTWR